MLKGDDRIVLAVIEEYRSMPWEFSSKTIFQSTLKLPAFTTNKRHCNQENPCQAMLNMLLYKKSQKNVCAY
jgi:hypothetical protein